MQGSAQVILQRSQFFIVGSALTFLPSSTLKDGNETHEQFPFDIDQDMQSGKEALEKHLGWWEEEEAQSGE
jgi:hypothetical protein